MLPLQPEQGSAELLMEPLASSGAVSVSAAAVAGAGAEQRGFCVLPELWLAVWSSTGHSCQGERSRETKVELRLWSLGQLW